MQKHQHQQKLTKLNNIKEKAEKIKEKNIYFFINQNNNPRNQRKTKKRKNLPHTT